MKTLFSLVSITIYFSVEVATAGLGPQISPQGVFQGLCLLDYSEYEAEPIYKEVCSGVLISPKKILTAAHCLNVALPKRVRCGIAGRVSVISPIENSPVDIHPLFKDLYSVGNTAVLIWDVALLHLEHSLPGVPVDFMPVEKVQADSACGIFGFSKLLGGRRLGKDLPLPIKGWQVSGDMIARLEDLPIISVSGLVGRGALIEPGDSGGALMCRDQNGTWKLLGTTSARDMSYNSLFTESKAIESWLGDIKSFDEKTLRQAEWAQQNYILTSAKEEFQNLNKTFQDMISHYSNLLNPEARISSDFDSRAEDLIHKESSLTMKPIEIVQLSKQWEALTRAKMKALQTWLLEQKGFSLRIKPYSLVYIPSIGQTPTSILDSHYNFFDYKTGPDEQGWITGDLQLLGYSENFSHPIAEFRVDSPAFRNISVRIEDLELKLFKVKK